MIRVALVDDQAIVRAGLARILSPEDGFVVVAECADGRQAVESCPPFARTWCSWTSACRSSTASRRPRSCAPRAEPLLVLVLTTFGEDEVLWGAHRGRRRRVRAQGLLRGGSDRGGPGGRRRRGLARPGGRSKGSRLLPPAWSAPAAREAARLDSLTDREHDVLRLMARGATNAEIAGALHVAEATVKTHVGSIFAKLGVRDRAAAIVFAYDHGVVTPGATPPVVPWVGAQVGPVGRCATARRGVASSA